MEMMQLSYFVAVAKALNFREAARRLEVSQSSISRQIGDLEKVLGVQLFVRTNRAVSLTDEGAAFLPYAMDIIGTAESAEFLMERFKKGATGHISISAISTSSAVLTHTLDIFFKRYPDIIVDVALNSGSDQLTAMTENKYDFHFAHRDMLPTDDRLDWLVTHTDSMALVVPKGHPLTKNSLNFIDLEKERFIISLEPGRPLLYNQILDICKTHGFTPNIMNRYDKVESVLLAISAGLGISIMPMTLPQVFFPNAVDIIPIADMDTSRTYIAAWPKIMTNPSAKLFLEVLRERFDGCESNG